jgi:hypothetical protein
MGGSARLCSVARISRSTFIAIAGGRKFPAHPTDNPLS